ncbi:acyltransferase [Bacteroidia bacterium]|nr:acyltransferase [Bacteroidia bacterium]
MKKVTGLDSLRFVCAVIVLLSHGVVPEFSETLIEQYRIIYYLDIVQKCLRPPGLAAVMVFFVISGFVIHYPYSQGKKINVLEFYCKRVCRIGIPAIVAFCIYHFTFGLYLAVVWSLICEVIYYLLYPLILKYKNKHMRLILIIAFAMSYIVSVSYDIFSVGTSGAFHRYGFFLTWIVGLPVWLLGVVLADKYKSEIAPERDHSLTHSLTHSLIKLWAWRIVTYLAASFLHRLGFFGVVSVVYTMPVFAFLVFYWVGYEIEYYKDKTENKILEYGGLMSYSLYLVHAYTIFIVTHYSGMNKISNDYLLCFSAIILSLFASWIFYITIEKTSHKLARSIKIKIK